MPINALPLRSLTPLPPLTPVNSPEPASQRVISPPNSTVALKPTTIANPYAAAQPANFLVRMFIRGFLKISWAFGGASDKVDGIPRLTGTQFKAAVPYLQPGDIILNGNNGGLTHLSVHVGDGQVVHSMATNETMRGVDGAIWDSIKASFGFGPKEDLTGVLKEDFGNFLDRFERDTFIVLRRPELTAAQREKGIAHLNSLVGHPYDYDFSAGDDEYYCTELALEYLDAALETRHSTIFNTEHHNYGIFVTDAIAPHNVLENPTLSPIIASKSAEIHFKAHLGEATIL